jgi:hypothetical protein
MVMTPPPAAQLFKAGHDLCELDLTGLVSEDRGLYESG